MATTKNIVEEAHARLRRNPGATMRVKCKDVVSASGGEVPAPAAAPVAAPDHETLKELDLLRDIVVAAEEKGRKQLGKALDAYRAEFPNPDADGSDSDDENDDNTDDE